MMEIRRTREFEIWVRSLVDRKARLRIYARVDRLVVGNPGDVKPVGQGVSELRVNHGPGYRIYFVQKGRTLVVLLCGGDKSSQSKDIAKAKILAEEWIDGT
jgi:putative addiction module killer protein